MELSILIVNYNVTALLKKCLESLRRNISNVEYEIIVVDNASPDNTWEKLIPLFPEVKFIPFSENAGFSKANNLAAGAATGKYLLLLNPDTEFDGNFMRNVLDFAESKADFGCLGVRLHDRDGKFHPESKRSVPTLYNTFFKIFVPFIFSSSKYSYYRNNVAESQIAEVEVVTGAFLLVKKKDYEAVDGLDTRYFMYGEDIDFCYTLLKLGKKNWYYGKASVLHYKGESTVKDLQYFRNFYGAMQLFAEKYYQQKPLERFLILSGLKLRYFIARISGK